MKQETSLAEVPPPQPGIPPAIGRPRSHLDSTLHHCGARQRVTDLISAHSRIPELCGASHATKNASDEQIDATKRCERGPGFE